MVDVNQEMPEVNYSSVLGDPVCCLRVIMQKPVKRFTYDLELSFHG